MIDNKLYGGWQATLAQFFAWMITSVLAVLDALAIREGILALLAIFSVVQREAYHRRGGLGEDIFTSFGLTAIDNVALLLLGCGAIAAVIYIEYYFRKGRPLGFLYKRIGKVFAIEIAILVIVLVVRQLSGAILQGMGS